MGNITLTPVIGFHYGAANRGELRSLRRHSLILVLELGFVFLLPALFGPDGIWFAVDAAELCCLGVSAWLLTHVKPSYS